MSAKGELGDGRGEEGRTVIDQGRVDTDFATFRELQGVRMGITDKVKTYLEKIGIPVVDVGQTDAHQGPVAVELLRSLHVVSRCTQTSAYALQTFEGAHSP